VVATAIVLVSCGGVSTEEQPRAIDSANVPESLLAEQKETVDGEGTTTVPPPPGEVPGPAVWFIRTEQEDVDLVAVPRDLSTPVTMTKLLEALLVQVPTEEERAQNITTAIPETTELAGPPRAFPGEPDVVVVNLTAGIFDVRGADLRNAFAQIVCTVTEAEGIEGFEDVTHARVWVDGQPTSVLDGRGAETRNPVNCNDDYRNLLVDADG
jgi:spore germination protein GerM